MSAPNQFAKLPALSIRQPWAWLILRGDKPIENRCWATKFRGRFLIHAAKGMTKAEYEDAFDFACYCGFDIHRAPSFRDFDGMRGGIVGVANLVDCVTSSDSPWFVGEHGFVLADVQTIPFIPCKGALGFFYPRELAG
jgi:hypothetical protein